MPGEEIASISYKRMSFLSLEQLLSKVWRPLSLQQFTVQVLAFEYEFRELIYFQFTFCEADFWKLNIYFLYFNANNDFGAW